MFLFFFFSFFFLYIFFSRDKIQSIIFIHLRIYKKGTQSYIFFFFFSRKETSLKDNKRGERYDLDIVCYPCLSIDLLYDFKKVQPMPNQPRDLFLTLYYFRRRNHYPYLAFSSSLSLHHLESG